MPSRRGASALAARLSRLLLSYSARGDSKELATTPERARSISSSWASTSTASTSTTSSLPSFCEIRQYTLHPHKTNDFISCTADTIELRKQMPFLAMLQCEIGDLNTMTHFYLYSSLSERDKARAALASQKEWTRDYLPLSRVCVVSQSSILVQVDEEEVVEAAKRLAREENGNEKITTPGVFDFTISAPPPPFFARVAGDPSTVGSTNLASSFGIGSSRASAREAASVRHGGALALRGHVVVGGASGTSGSGGNAVAVGSLVEVWRFSDAASAVSNRSAADSPVAGVSRQLLKPLAFSPWQ